MRNQENVIRYAAYSDEYKEICFQTWYSLGRPSSTPRLLETLKEDELGRKPAAVVLNEWKKERNWDFRADDLDARAIAITEDALVLQKAEMLKRHADAAKRVAEKALEFLQDEGFDSSASAVQAYFKGTEEERIVRGIGDMIVRMSKMTEGDLKQNIEALLKRANDNDQIIDADEVDTVLPEEKDEE